MLIFAVTEEKQIKNTYIMKKILMAAFVAATLCTGTAFAQPAAVKKIIETAKTDNQTMHHLDILSNRFGGRLIGS